MVTYLTARIDAPCSAVWQLLGPGFARVGEWSTSCLESRPHKVPDPVLRAPAPGRQCRSTISGVRGVVERVVAYDPERHLAYEVVSGLPPFLSAARSDWSLASSGPDATQVTVTGNLIFARPVRLIAPIFERYVRRLSARAVAELEHMARYGVPTQRKQRQLQRRH
jgi:hypothetical protein